MLLSTAVGEISKVRCGVEEVICCSLDSQERSCP